jgi:DNA-directed RNA polymerase specialized sigma24 family protein
VRADDSPNSPAPLGHRVHADDATVIGLSVSDPEQFAIVFRRHAPAIQRHVTRRIGHAAADDVVAETFVVAFRQRASYRDDERDCLPWLYGIATNLVGRHWAAVREPAGSGASLHRVRRWRHATVALPGATAVGSLNRRRLQRAVAVAAAAAIGTAGVVGLAMSAASGHATAPREIAWSGRPTAMSGSLVHPSLGRARTEAELVDYATRAAVISPAHAPGPHKWIVVKTEFADSSAGGGAFCSNRPTSESSACSGSGSTGVSTHRSMSMSGPASRPARWHTVRSG